ncbi:MAG: MATE family efflux transporter [Clostridia bacterium]|nr:MATE family efflux transporter [Clostridia bacterium]
MAARNSMDLTQGSVFKKLIVFVIPILLTNLLQQLYHTADVVVVGNFARDSQNALASVGSSGTVTTLLLNLFWGLSVGTNVICANFYGAGKKEELTRAMETSIAVAAVSGVVIGVVGFFLAEPILTAMGVPQGVLPNAVIYMKIIFLGQPGSLVYNFGASILRAHGDTKRPMTILFISGMVNVVLNLVFVAVFHLDSAGVALATTISNYVSAALILWILGNPHGEQHLDLRHLRVSAPLLKRIAVIGIPGGLNGIVFSVSNIIIARAIFTLGETVVAADSAGTSVTNLVYIVLTSFYSASISFSGQNYGAGQLGRIHQFLWRCVLLCGSLLFFVSTVVNLFPDFFMGLFTDNQAVIEAGRERLFVVSYSYVLYTVSETVIGCLRGMGKSVMPTALNAFFVCVPRIIWVAFVVPIRPGLGMIYSCYAVSYVLSGIAQISAFYYYMAKEKKQRAASSAGRYCAPVS